jgi:uncharacterized protein YjbJ (UPF0337 family)
MVRRKTHALDNFSGVARTLAVGLCGIPRAWSLHPHPADHCVGGVSYSVDRRETIYLRKLPSRVGNQIRLLFLSRQVFRDAPGSILISQLPGALQAKEIQPMNKDQVTGKVEQVAGRVKQGVGETLGNQKLANQGVADQVKGAARETWGNAKDAAGVTADRKQKEAEVKANDARAGVRDKVGEMHDSINEKLDAHKANERAKSKSA